MTKSKFLDLLNRVASNKNRDLFMVELGVTLFLAKVGIAGTLAKILGSLLKGIVGVLMEEGVFLIDISLDAIREGMKIPAFEKRAKEAYDRAMAKPYDEATKEKIRRQYLEILSQIVPVGDGPK